MVLKFDDILSKYVGPFKNFQKKRVAAIAVLASIISINSSFGSVFLAFEPDHHCKIPSQLQDFNCTKELINDYAFPKNANEDVTSHNQCSMLKRNYSGVVENDVCIKNNRTDDEQMNTVACTEWIYDIDESRTTVVTEWDLVCDRKSLAKTTAGVFLAARIFGVFISGWLADRFGRKYVFAVCGLIEGAAYLASGFMPSYGWFVAMRIIMGLANLGFGSVIWLLGVEYVGVNDRAMYWAMISASLALCYLVLAGFAYFITQWRTLCIVLGSLEIVLVLLLAFYMKESPRWLLTKGRKKEAWKILTDMARDNKRELPELKDVELEIKKDQTTKVSPLDLVRTPGLRTVTLLSCWCWFSLAFVYFGLTLNISDFGGDRFLNFCISGLVEIPAHLVAWYAPQRFGRIWIYSGAFIATAIPLLCITVIPQGYTTVIVVLASIGKFFICMTFLLCYLHSTEVYSTSIRSMGLNTCSAMARLGTTLAAYIGLLASVHHTLPLIAYAVCSVTAGMCALLLPETRGIPLMQSVEECEQFARQNLCNKCCRRSTAMRTEEVKAEEASLKLKHIDSDNEVMV